MHSTLEGVYQFLFFLGRMGKNENSNRNISGKSTNSLVCRDCINSEERCRMCVDLTHLNANVFSKLHAKSGFWQIKLAESSTLLTTFITPYSRFYFNRLPFGITSALEYFQRRRSEMFTGLQGVVYHMDDILIHGKCQEEHDMRLEAVLEN